MADTNEVEDLLHRLRDRCHKDMKDAVWDDLASFLRKSKHEFTPDNDALDLHEPRDLLICPLEVEDVDVDPDGPIIDRRIALIDWMRARGQAENEIGLAVHFFDQANPTSGSGSEEDEEDDDDDDIEDD